MSAPSPAYATDLSGWDRETQEFVNGRPLPGPRRDRDHRAVPAIVPVRNAFTSFLKSVHYGLAARYRRARLRGRPLCSSERIWGAGSYGTRFISISTASPIDSTMYSATAAES